MNYLSRWQRPELATWAGFGRLSSLRDEIDRLFEAPLSELAHTTQLLSGWTPALDVFEDKDNLVVRVELPGMKREDIDVSLHDGTLSISGERKSDNKYEDAEVFRTERFFGRFQRSVSLPTPVASDKVKAQYTDGVLTITLPKTEEAKPKQIEVSVSQAETNRSQRELMD
ncbi:Heat shock protein Hsp20 [Verrucomicrobia bacterium]|nr:Heat shock protein Hsp20 [Verrucomicrobiota bacterium]